MVTIYSLECHHRSIGFGGYLSDYVAIDIWQTTFFNFLSECDGTHLQHLSLESHSDFSSTFDELLKLHPYWSMMGLWPLIWLWFDGQYFLWHFRCLTPKVNQGPSIHLDPMTATPWENTHGLFTKRLNRWSEIHHWDVIIGGPLDQAITFLTALFSELD